MEITFNDIKYIFKEYLTFEEETEVDILTTLLPTIMGLDKSGDEGLLELITNNEFREKGRKLISAMSLNPKLTVEELGKWKSPQILSAMLECVKTYALSFASSFAIDDPDKKKSLASPTLLPQ